MPHNPLPGAPRGPSHLHAALIGSVPARSPPASSCGPVRGCVRLSVVAMLNQTVIIGLYLPHSPPFLTPPSTPPLSASDGPLSVWHLALYCQASGGSHLKITLPGHTQASLNACQFTHGKRITRLLRGSPKLLLMAMQIIRVHLALPANRFFMRVRS